MKSQQSTERPSAEAQHVLWNVPPGSVESKTVKYQYRASVLNPPPLQPGEVDNLKLEAKEVARDNERRAGIPRYDEFGDESCRHAEFMFAYEANGLLAPIDRTLMTESTNEELFTSEYVRDIQKRAFATCPLWRLYVYGMRRHAEPELMIYRDAITIGSTQCRSEDVEQSLAAWRQVIREIRDRSRGVRQRQFRYVMQRVRSAAAQLTQQPIVRIAAFDRVGGNNARAGFWALQKETYMSFMFVESAEAFGHGEMIQLDSSFRVIPGLLKNKPTAAYYLYQWTYPTAPEVKMVFQHPGHPFDDWRIDRTYNPNRPSWTIGIRPEDLISDEQLKADPSLSRPVSELIPIPLESSEQ